jgi:hypothetical protein
MTMMPPSIIVLPRTFNRSHRSSSLRSLVSSVVNPDVPINDALYPGSLDEGEESGCPPENPDNPYEIPTR